MKYGFLGCGNMGGAIARALSLKTKDIAVTDRSGRAKLLAQELGVTYSDNASIASDCDRIFLAVKPHMMKDMLLNLRQTLASKILDLQKDAVYTKFKDMEGELVSGEVYQVWKREVLLLDDDKNELLLPKDQQIPTDIYRKGETVRAVIYNVDNKYVEFKVTVPDKMPERYAKIAQMVAKRYNLKIKKLTKKDIFQGGYGQRIFQLINETYKDLYGFSELTHRQIDQYVDMYLKLADLNLITVIEDGNHGDKLAAARSCRAMVAISAIAPTTAISAVMASSLPTAGSRASCRM